MLREVDTGTVKSEKLRYLNILGWKWAVLAWMWQRLNDDGIDTPRIVDDLIRMSKLKISSGCFSPCEVDCELMRLEAELFPLVVDLGDDKINRFSEMMERAVNGGFTSRDVKRLKAIPIVSECTFISCSC